MKYVDYGNGKSEWKRIPLNDVPSVITDASFFITWQIYTSEEHGQFGASWGDFKMDFDDADNPDLARKDCIAAYKVFMKAGIPDSNMNIYFSGNKGFHLEIPYQTFLDRPYFNLHDIYKFMARKIDSTISVDKKKSTLDYSIYKIRSLFRYPNTLHEKTRLYCVPITYAELQKTMDEIRSIAEWPRQLEKHPVWSLPMRRLFESNELNFIMSCTEMSNREKKISAYLDGKTPPCIQKVLDEGTPQGTRNEMLYKLVRSISKNHDEEKTREIIAPWIDITGLHLEQNKTEATIRSALKPEGQFNSCACFYKWCDKEKCNTMCDESEAKKIDNVQKNFTETKYVSGVRSVNEKLEKGEWKRVLKTGIKYLDNVSRVISDSVVVIASLSDHGKTSFAITIMRNNPDKKFIYLSIEEGIDRAIMRLNQAEYEGMDNVLVANCEISKVSPEKIDDFLCLRKGYDVLIVDQLINMACEDSGIKERIKYKKIMEGIRNMARHYKIPVFMLHQLGRQTLLADEPQKEHLAEGADIERLAYDIWLIYRKKINGVFYNVLKIDKNKFHRSGIKIPLIYDFSKNIFTEIHTHGDDVDKALEIYVGDYFEEQIDEFRLKEIMNNHVHEQERY